MSDIPKIDAEKFALAVVASVSLKGDSPESIAEEQIAYYLAAYKKAEELNQPKNKVKLLERYQRLYGEI